MSNLQEIERAVSQLSEKEIFEFGLQNSIQKYGIGSLRKMSRQVGLMISLSEHYDICVKDVVPICEYPATPDFWYHYRQLPSEVQELAERCYELLNQDSRYPSLHFKKVGSFWSVRN